MIETITTLTVLSLIGYLIYKIVNISREDDSENANLKVVGLVFVLAFIIGSAPVLGYGVFRGWILSTGFRDVNQVTLKPQEVKYPEYRIDTIDTNGVLPDASTRKKARALVNPVRPTADSIREGKDLFYNYCEPCHGETGDGQGIMGSVPMLKRKPVDGDDISLGIYLSNFTGFEPQFDISYVQNGSDGDLYYTITNGGEAIMPSYKDALSVEQRWHLINYIKKELSKI